MPYVSVPKTNPETRSLVPKNRIVLPGSMRKKLKDNDPTIPFMWVRIFASFFYSFGALNFCTQLKIKSAGANEMLDKYNFYSKAMAKAMAKYSQTCMNWSPLFALSSEMFSI